MLNASVETRVGYFAFGLKIFSEIPFSELTVLYEESGAANADVEIVMEPYLKNGFSSEAVECVVDHETVTFQMPDCGVFRMKSGNKIIVSPYAGADEDLIRLYILGTCMGIILMQRSVYPLHGSAVVINGDAYAFVGESGAGKSTLASAFAERGYQLVTDDIVALSLSVLDESPMVTPSYPQQKLWQQSLDAFGMDNVELRPIYGRETKFCVSVKDKYCEAPVRLAGIFELGITDNEEISIHRASKLETLQLLFQHTYRQFLLSEMKLSDWHFRFSSQLGERFPIYRLKRSRNLFSAPQLVDLILKTIDTEE